MFKSKSVHTKSVLTAVLLVLATAPLAGCISDDLADNRAIEPYGGSKAHPIKVVNGKAVVDPCGQWPSDLAQTESNMMSANHGCAVQSNIAAMAAYPQDLVRMRRTSPSPAYAGAAAVKKLTDGSSSSSTSSTSSTSAGTTSAAP